MSNFMVFIAHSWRIPSARLDIPFKSGIEKVTPLKLLLYSGKVCVTQLRVNGGLMREHPHMGNFPLRPFESRLRFEC